MQHCLNNLELKIFLKSFVRIWDKISTNCSVLQIADLSRSHENLCFQLEYIFTAVHYSADLAILNVKIKDKFNGWDNQTKQVGMCFICVIRTPFYSLYWPLTTVQVEHSTKSFWPIEFDRSKLAFWATSQHPKK